MSRKRGKHSPSRRGDRVGKPRLCKVCGRGRYEGQGQAADGRPRYVCGNCGDSYTRGKQGEPWDVAKEER